MNRTNDAAIKTTFIEEEEINKRLTRLDSFLTSRFFLDMFIFGDYFSNAHMLGWEFVIKINALLETFLIESLVLHSGNEEHRSLFASLPILQDKPGKNSQLKILQKSGIVDSEDEKLIRLLLDMKQKFISRAGLLHMELDHYFLMHENVHSDRRQSIIDALLLRRKRTQKFLTTLMKKRTTSNERNTFNAQDIISSFDERRAIDSEVKVHIDKLLASNPKVAVLSAFEALSFTLAL